MSGEKTKPANLRPNVMPSDGYMLSVDGKLKTRFETSEDAMTAGLKLKQDFPVLQVSVFAVSLQKNNTVTLPE